MLYELQQNFIEALQDNSLEAGGHLFRRGRTHKPPITIYRDSIRAQFIRTLGEIYPVTAQLVGEQFFDYMAREYIAEYWSCSPDLGDYGRDLAAFTETFAPAQSLVYLPDVMRLEWTWHRAFNASDPDEGNIQSLASLDEAQYYQVILHLHPTASLLGSPYPIHRIWHMHQPEADPHIKVSLDEGGVNLIIWRKGLDMRIDTVSETQWDCLRDMAAGTSLGELADIHGVTPLWNLLVKLLERGFVYRYSIGGRMPAAVFVNDESQL